MAAAHMAHHIMWIQNLLNEFNLDSKSFPMSLLIDNRSAIDLAKESRHHQRTKHIDTTHHFVREQVANDTISVIHCPGMEMLADGFTKALARPLLNKMRDGLRVMPG
jgi:hypothetical protein